MERFFLSVIRRRKLVLILAAIAFALAVCAMFNTNLNSDVARYLSGGSVSKQTITILREDFGINGDAEICAEGGPGNYEELSALVAEISALPEVAEIQWLGSYEGLFSFEDGEIVSAEALIPDDNVRNMVGGLFFEYEGKDYYLISISLAAANATGEAGQALHSIDELFAGYGLPYYLGGTAVQSNDMLEGALGALPKFIIVAVVVILVILLLSTSSVAAALVILVSIGASIVYNLGTNFFTEDISTITFSVAAILQLALSMDYSIFLTHAFEKARKGADDETAMIIALKKTMVVIVASALTTVAGFCALFAMKYTMGFDMGLCLAKGVSLSFLTVIIIQPCLMLCLRHTADKTAHKTIEPSFNGLAKLPEKLRTLAPVVVGVLIIPCMAIALSQNYYYLDSGFDAGASGPKGASQSTGTQAVFVVETGSGEQQLELAGMVESLDGVSSVTGYYSLIRNLAGGLSVPIYSSLTEQNKDTLMFELELEPAAVLNLIEGGSDALEDAVSSKISAYASRTAPALIQEAIAKQTAALGRALTGEERDALITGITDELTAGLSGLVAAQLGSLEDGLSSFSDQLGSYKDRFFADIDGTEYTFFTAKILGEPEGKEALDTVYMISWTAKTVLGTDTVYVSGSTQSVSDLADTTQTDFYIVSGLSAVLILIILLFTFKDFLTSLLLIVVIELAIFINLSITTLMGGELNFMSYIVISAIQLGATIDYAILMAKTFRQELRDFDRYKAIKRAIRQCAFPIIISVSILCGACLSVYFISSDTIIREITMLIARGSFISGVMVLFILPALLPRVPLFNREKR